MTDDVKNYFRACAVFLTMLLFAVLTTVIAVQLARWIEAGPAYSKSLWGDGVTMGTNGVVTNK